MFIQLVKFSNFGVFSDATFDLSTESGRPIVLITGNNGAGKTSILEGLRLVLHGRRAFDVAISEAEYLRQMTGRFHVGDFSRPCSVAIEFEYVDDHRTRSVRAERSWVQRKQNVSEELRVTVDGNALLLEDAEDLLASVVPPEVARYFLFDGERIRELAEWEVGDESALFTAVSDLLGLGVLDQLRLDMLRLSAHDGKSRKQADAAVGALLNAQTRAREIEAEVRAAQADEKRLRTAVDRARAEVRRIGALAHDEFAALEIEIAQLEAERSSLSEEAMRSASDILPLLCARTLRHRFAKDLAARRAIEEREIVTTFFEKNETLMRADMVDAGIKLADARKALRVVAMAVRGDLVPVNSALSDLSRSDALWMERVIDREIPDMCNRNRALFERLIHLDSLIDVRRSRRAAAPKDDPASEAALQALEDCQRLYVAHEASIADIDRRQLEIDRALASAQDGVKIHRVEAFRNGRLRAREHVGRRVLEALPTLAARLQASKEKRFARYLGEALRGLWNKTDRLVDVQVSFVEKRIALYSLHGEIRKRDLSAGEKQLFAVAFIHALARLSGRHMPFVIDTPLGRLDREHRRRFVAEFLPAASHQVVLLSTDTEIVGELYSDLKPFVSRHHELAEQNGGTTAPVELTA